MKKFSGTGVALITPFINNTIDFIALGTIIDFVINEGIDFLVLLGSTGEAGLLSEEEQREVLDFGIKYTAGRVPIVAGNFGSVSTDQLCQKINHYNFDGIDAILSSCPSYVKPGQEGLYQHFHHISDCTPVPVILYNVPSRTAVNMSWQTTVRLAENHSNIIAIKEASNDLTQCKQIVKHKPSDFLLLSGDDEMTLPIIKLGGKGVISVIANAYPSIFSGLVRAALKADWSEAEFKNKLLKNVHPWLYKEGNPTGIKAAMEILEFCEREVRLPLMAMTEETYQHLRAEMSRIKFP